MPLTQLERKTIRDILKLLDEQDSLATPVKESGGQYGVKAHPLAPPAGPDGVRPAALSHEAFSYLHEGPDDNCGFCRHLTLNKLQREKLQELLK